MINTSTQRGTATTRIFQHARLGILVVFCGQLVVATAMAAAPPSAKLPFGKFSGWAEIDATGRLQSFIPDGSANAATTRGISDELKKTEFVPASNPGGPMATRVYLTGNYALQEVGEDYALRVSGVRTGPKITRLVTPRPIIRVLTGMTPAIWGRVCFAIAANGKPTDIAVEATSHFGDFDREMQDAVKKWQFDPESVAAFPIGFRLRQDFSIHFKETSAPIKSDCPDVAPQGVHVRGQTTCLPSLSIELSKPTRLGKEFRVDSPR